MVQDTWPTQISSGTGVSTSTTSPVDGNGGGGDGTGDASVPVVTYNNNDKRLEFSRGVNSINIIGTTPIGVLGGNGWLHILNNNYMSENPNVVLNSFNIEFMYNQAPILTLTLGIFNKDIHGDLVLDSDKQPIKTQYEYNIGGTIDNVTLSQGKQIIAT